MATVTSGSPGLGRVRRGDLPYVNVVQAGAVGNGVADDSVRVQAIIDANKGKRIIFPSGYTFLMAGLTLDGSSYDGTVLDFQGELLLAPAPSASSDNYGGAWNGLILKGCDNILIPSFRAHGNRANQPDSEQQVILGIYGATNVTIPLVIGREMRGDLINLNALTVATESAMPQGVVLGDVLASNSAADGRNAITVICGSDITCSSLTSINVGGVVDGSRMPGGLDIEPNYDWNRANRIAFGRISVIGEGSNNCSVHGRAGVDVTADVSIGELIVRNTITPTVNDENTNPTATNSYCLLVAMASRVNIGKATLSYSTAYGDAAVFSQCSDVTANITASHARAGAVIGVNAIGAGTQLDVVRSDITVNADSVSRYGVNVGHTVDTTIKGRITNPVAGMYTLFAVHTQKVNNTQPQVRTRYSIDVPYDADWTMAYWTDNTLTQTFTDCIVENCQVKGFGDTEGAGSLQIMRRNVEGVTTGTAAPIGGYWLRGSERVNSTPSASGTAGWVCTASGTPGTWNARANIAA